MLDIYFVPFSCRAMPKDPRGLVHVGSIDFDAHRSLAVVFDQCGHAGANLSYFGDSLLLDGRDRHRKDQHVRLMVAIVRMEEPAGDLDRLALEALERSHVLFVERHVQ